MCSDHWDLWAEFPAVLSGTKALAQTVSAKPSAGGEVNHPNIRGSCEAVLKVKRKQRGGWGFSPASSRAHLQSTPLLNRLWHPSSSQSSGISDFRLSAWCNFIFWKWTAIWILVLRDSDECSPDEDKSFCSWTYSMHESCFCNLSSATLRAKNGAGRKLDFSSNYISLDTKASTVELWIKLTQRRWCVCHFTMKEISLLCSEKGIVLTEMNTV